MSIAVEIERLQTEPMKESDFAVQLDTMRRRSEEQGASAEVRHPVGVDRSRDLSPVLRPHLVRALVR